MDPLRWEVLPWFAERSAVVTALASLTGDAPRLASPSRVIGRQLTALDQRGWDLASGKLASQRYLAQFGHTPAPSVAWVKVFGSPDEKTAVRVFIEAVDGVVIAVYLRLFSRVPNLESWLQQALGRAPDAVDGADLRSHPRHVTFSFPGGSGRPRPARTRVALWRADAQTLVHTREFQNLRTSVAWRAVVAADARALASWAEARGYRMPLPVTSWGDR